MYKNGAPNYNEIIFTPEQIKDIVDSYLGGESSVKIGLRYGTSHKPILKTIRTAGVSDIRGNRFTRKYELNEHYFDVIDTPEKAYIFGFLLADGHNELKKCTIQMSLQEEDKYILESMRKELKSSKPLEFIDYSNKHDYGYTYKNQYRLEFFSSYMCKILKEKGMIPSKSRSLKYPECVSEELTRHFIRGYFDGNGTINKKTGSIVVLSTKAFCEGLKEHIDSALSIDTGYLIESSNHNGITFDLRYNKRNDAGRILKWMYEDASLFLYRKYDLFCLLYPQYQETLC